MHAVLPTAAANKPAPQLGHDEAPKAATAVPTTHDGQYPAPAAEDAPAGQLLHDAEPVLTAYVPAAQLVHALAPLPE